MAPDRNASQPSGVPGAAELARMQAELAAVQGSPWLASLFMRRLGMLRARLAQFRDWLASLPRRVRRGWARRWSHALPAAALVLALARGLAQAATITVDPGGSGCTLADAISAANTDTAIGSCTAGDVGVDTITFANANGTYGYASPLPAITTAIIIQGNGDTAITRTGGPAFSVLRVTGGGSLALANATISGAALATAPASSSTPARSA